MYRLAKKRTAEKRAEENASMSFSDTDEHACIDHIFELIDVVD